MAWFDERLSISSLVAIAKKKEVPLHRHSIWYYFGGMTLFLFVVQVVTGILLLLYYRPSSEGAFESVQFIITEVKFGWLIRSIHSWSANLMIATLFIHMFSVFFLRGYYPPREITWLSGVFLLFIVICFGFSGYLLPWNKLAFFATKVGTEIAGVVPVVGRPILRFLRGGDDVTGATLTRFFGFHVAVLPATARVQTLVSDPEGRTLWAGTETTSLRPGGMNVRDTFDSERPGPRSRPWIRAVASFSPRGT